MLFNPSLSCVQVHRDNDWLIKPPVPLCVRRAPPLAKPLSDLDMDKRNSGSACGRTAAASSSQQFTDAAVYETRKSATVFFFF